MPAWGEIPPKLGQFDPFSHLTALSIILIISSFFITY